MTRKAIAAKVNSALSRNSAAYSEGRVVREPKNDTKKSITDRLYQASKLGRVAEARKNGKDK
jgi:hypothetical protein